MLAVVIALSASLASPSGQSAGLLMTSIIGFVTAVGGVPCFFGLPRFPTKPLPKQAVWRVLAEIFTPLQLLWRRKNMLFLLTAYTVYTDNTFALNSILGQLYFSELKPDTFEFSLYAFALAGNFITLVSTVAYFLIQRRTMWKLETCLIWGYALMVIVPIWGTIGLANVDFGNKHRWEFYVQLVLLYLSGSIVNPTFRLLYAEMIPPGEEMMWLGLQGALSCATTWVSYVATGTLQNTAHNLRFPLIICAVLFLVPLVLGCLRGSLSMFEADKVKWQAQGAVTDRADSREH